MAEEIEVLDRGSDMVLAAHRTPVGWGTVATTIETVRFDRPATVAFRLLRGPVPHVVERFTLHDDAGSTTWASSPPTSGSSAAGGGTRWLASWRRLCGVPSSASATKQNGERQQPAGTGIGDDPRSGQSGERPTPGRAKARHRDTE